MKLCSFKHYKASLMCSWHWLLQSGPSLPPLPLCSQCTDQHYWLLLYHCKHSCVDLLALQRHWSPSLALSLRCRSSHGGPYCTPSFTELARSTFMPLTVTAEVSASIFILFFSSRLGAWGTFLHKSVTNKNCSVKLFNNACETPLTAAYKVQPLYNINISWRLRWRWHFRLWD